MKTLVTFCLIAITFLACTKTGITPFEKSISAGNKDEVTAVQKRSAIITAHPWMYKALYFNYVDEQHTGDTEYERGASNNIINFDDTRITFHANGSFVETEDGSRTPGKWWFTDKTGTKLVMQFSYDTDTDSIITLNIKQFNFTKPIGYHSKSYTELITAE